MFCDKKNTNTVPWALINLNGGEIIETFYEKELQKTSQEKN